jgi:hypothetical protein
MRVLAGGSIDAAKPVKEGLNEQQLADLLAATQAQEVREGAVGRQCEGREEVGVKGGDHPQRKQGVKGGRPEVLLYGPDFQPTSCRLKMIFSQLQHVCALETSIRE